MRRLFLLSAIPLLFDAGVAACLGVGGKTVSHPRQAEAARGYVVFFDWDQAGLSATNPRMTTRLEVSGAVDQAAGADYMAALTLERARRVRAKLLRDGLTTEAVLF